VGSSEPGSAPDQPGVGNGLTTAPHPAERGRLRPRQMWALALSAGAAAGVVSWLGGEWALTAFRPRTFKVQIMLMTYIQPTTASQNAADFKNATLAFAILGSATGLAMGSAGGLAGRSPSRGVIVGWGGAALGGLVGAIASWYLLPLFYRRFVPDPNDLLSPILIHGGLWTAIGAVGGAAFAIGMGCGRRVPQAILGAGAGAALATVLFHLLAASLFPDSRSTEPVAASSTVRLLSRMLVTVLVAAGAARGAQGRFSRAKAPGPLQEI
jgi:hypothetical protein